MRTTLETFFYFAFAYPLIHWYATVPAGAAAYVLAVRTVPSQRVLGALSMLLAIAFFMLCAASETVAMHYVALAAISTIVVPYSFGIFSLHA